MSDIKIYQAVWAKFLPLIAMKLRAAAKNGEAQTVSMDKIDFEKTSIRKNTKFQFNLEMNEGRTLNSKTTSAIAHDFARALNENEATKDLLKKGIFKFNLDNKFVLSIQPATQPVS